VIQLHARDMAARARRMVRAGWLAVKFGVIDRKGPLVIATLTQGAEFHQARTFSEPPPRRCADAQIAVKFRRPRKSPGVLGSPAGGEVYRTMI
jgi:hypothetical protein